MSFLGLRVPHETARLLSELDIPGRKDSTDHFHITILHLGDNVPIETIAKALVATFKVSDQTQPFTVSTSRVSCFAPKVSKTSSKNGQCPIICRVDSDELHAMRVKLCASYDEAGVAYDKKFPEYKPHVTLGWADAEIEERRIPTVEWGAHELVLWGGDSGDRRVILTFPMSLKITASRRVVARYVGKSLLRDSPP